MPLVTVSRQCGSGGREIARAVAEILGATYVDRDLISEAARRIGVAESLVSRHDERVAGPTERLIEAVALAFTINRPARGGGRPPTSAGPTDAETAAATRHVIREIAKEGNAVFLGRGAQVVLRENPRVLNIHVVAPLAQRLATVMRRESVSAEKARQLIRDLEEERAAYLRAHYQADWEDPQLYHAVINTGLLPYSLAAQAIVVMATALDESHPLPQSEGSLGQDLSRLRESLQVMHEAARASLERYKHRL
ncbi:MAG: cytidylate kinase-like family protein [Chloroflexi bacterium]|nr:cytidylate kinase-like family protein [Chloroflexota bacterium]MCL5107959.1 cytidylate kinase-like family protein [Chloroflexota bacterium]